MCARWDVVPWWAQPQCGIAAADACQQVIKDNCHRKWHSCRDFVWGLNLGRGKAWKAGSIALHKAYNSLSNTSPTKHTEQKHTFHSACRCWPLVFQRGESRGPLRVGLNLDTIGSCGCAIMHAHPTHRVCSPRLRRSSSARACPSSGRAYQMYVDAGCHLTPLDAGCRWMSPWERLPST